MLAWTLFRNYLLSRRSGALVRIIAWHCVLGIVIGVGALVIVLSVMNGFNLTIRNRMLSVEPHLVHVTGDRPGAAETRRLTKALADIPGEGIESIRRYESQDLILRSGDGVFSGILARGYDEAALKDLLDRVWRMSASAVNVAPVESLGPDDVILGVDLGRSLGVFEGDEILLIPPETLLLPKGEIPKLRKFTVRALVSTQMPEIDSKLMYYNMDEFHKRIKSASREAGLEVRLKNPYEAEAIKSGLAKAGIKAQTWGDRDTSLFFALKMESLAMTLFLSLAVLITSFSIVIIMVLLMSQKRKDIGLFMSLGLSLHRTRLVFIGVGLLLSGLGILGGLVLGTSVCVFLDLYPLELLPDIYTDATLPAKLSARILFFVVGSSTLIAAIGSWLPVWRYILPNPAQALR